MVLLRGDRSVLAGPIQDRIAEIRRLTKKVAGLEKLTTTKVKESRTALTALHGIGFVVAAKILKEIGDPSRVRSKGAFAILTETAPLEASSGLTKRHRLNRGGNRQFKYAPDMMARSRLRHDPDTRAYVTRRGWRGTSDKEAVTCLKRPPIERGLPTAHGGPKGFYKRHYLPAVVTSGLDPSLCLSQDRTCDRRHRALYRFHDLRHTCAALLIAQGAHPKEIQEQMGHSTIRVTFDRYGHLFPSLHDRLRDDMDEMYAAAKDKAVPPQDAEVHELGSAASRWRK